MTVSMKQRALWHRCIALLVLIFAITLAGPAFASAKKLRIGIHPASLLQLRGQYRG